MTVDWKKAFSQAPGFELNNQADFSRHDSVNSLRKLRDFLDRVHIQHCLLRPYQEQEDYPTVDPRSLLPSFEPELYEHKNLPGFLMVAFARPISPFQEFFQFDRIHNIMDQPENSAGKSCPLENTVFDQNLQTLQSRLPKQYQDTLLQDFSNRDICYLENYPQILDYLLEMDRAHVLSTDPNGEFYLSGVYASFPSDLDSEIKRFGLRMSKFRPGDNCMYERNRLFVYQFLMELYGFSIVSERRTAAALFSRRLFRAGEEFMIRVLGQSDRTITTLYSHPEAKNYPRVEKMALVSLADAQKDLLAQLQDGGFFVDAKDKVVIIRVTYRQHKYNTDNVRQDRALSVIKQEIIHPLTAETISHHNIIKDTYNMILQLTDIVRGEYMGVINYKRLEFVHNTDTHEKRLKFLFTWLSKHQRRIIGYSDEFYSNVIKVLDSYLLAPENFETFNNMHDLYQEVWAKFSYIQQARKVKTLEDLEDRRFKGKTISYGEQLKIATDLLNELKFEIVNYFDELVESVLAIGNRILNDSYLRRKYISKPEDDLTEYGKTLKKLYGRLVSILDEFSQIRKSRKDKSEAFPLHMLL